MISQKDFTKEFNSSFFRIAPHCDWVAYNIYVDINRRFMDIDINSFLSNINSQEYYLQPFSIIYDFKNDIDRNLKKLLVKQVKQMLYADYQISKMQDYPDFCREHAIEFIRNVEL